MMFWIYERMMKGSEGWGDGGCLPSYQNAKWLAEETEKAEQLVSDAPWDFTAEKKSETC